ncbi:hybrid signal transduction histidine kinase A-like [Saccostrea echinata]|uniref:hybrid signal transduction histidine kinase A-like n=1 Tax=Saccostrea echinata TaxID=191078 RepID=UPI002A8037F8|nr:hybrid signal transduction histidine kinase A-like [Saccostrea echinata]
MLAILIFVFTTGIDSAISELKCTDYAGKEIPNGQVYQPKNDPCYQCTCSNGFPTMCKSVSCIPPTGCHNPVMIEGKCCAFRCDEDNSGGQGNFPTVNSTDPTRKNNDNGSSDNMTTLGLRLVASTITSFLVLALLLFMGHRLRQRRLLQAMRRYRDSRRRERLDEGDVDSFSPEFFGFECPSYDDPPPPYTPPKPPDQEFPREAPPPYEAIESSNNNNNASSPCPNNNNNIGCQTSPHTVQGTDTSLSGRGAEHISTLSHSCNQIVQRHHSLPGYSEHDPESSHSRGCENQSDRHGNFRFSLPWLRQNRQTQRGTQTLPTYNRHTDQVNFSPDLLELWEDTSTATTTSEIQDRSRFPSSGGRCMQPAHISELSDTDDLSTESGTQTDQYVQTSRHSYGCLPAVSTFNSNRPHPPPRRESNAGHDVSSLDEVSFHGSETRSVGVSHSSYNNSAEASNDQCVGATNILENDSVLEAEDNRRKLEQIHDSQNLRILRLSKLLQQSSDSSESACGHSCLNSYPNIQKSQSTHSGLSICSETGEKKLSVVEESALSNDVQYPCSGRMPSTLTNADTPSCCGISDNCGSSDCSSIMMPCAHGRCSCESSARFTPISQPNRSFSPQSVSSFERNNNSILNSSTYSSNKASRRAETVSKKQKRQSTQSKFYNDQSNGNYNRNGRSSSAPPRQLSFIDELKCRNKNISDRSLGPSSTDSNGCSTSAPTCNDSSEICDSHWHSASVKRNNSSVSHKSSSQSSSHSSHSGDGLLICPRKKKSRSAKRCRSKKTSDKRKPVQNTETENSENKQCSLV